MNIYVYINIQQTVIQKSAFRESVSMLFSSPVGTKFVISEREWSEWSGESKTNISFMSE